MQKQTETANRLALTEAAASYDANARYLLADPLLLAYILKYTVRELREMSREEIVDRLGKQEISESCFL